MPSTTSLPRWLFWSMRCLLCGFAVVTPLAFSCVCPVPQDPSAPVPELGPCGVQKAEVVVARPDSSTFAAVVYYPVQMSKADVPFARIAFPVPVIAFGHAYLVSPDYYDSTLEHLASNGYIVIATRSEGEWFPDHQAVADDLMLCLTSMTARSLDPGSTWYQQVDAERLALLGHSMGGGAAILAAAADSRVKVIATLAAAETRPSAVEAGARLTMPALYLYGTQDQITPPDQHALAIYENAGEPRLSMAIDGGCHCGFLDKPFIGCDAGMMSRTDQLALTWDKLTAFFDAYLRELPEARAELLAPSEDLAIEAQPPEFGQD